MALSKQVSHGLPTTLVIIRIDARPRRIGAGVDQYRRDLMSPQHIQHRRRDQAQRDAPIKTAVAEHLLDTFLGSTKVQEGWDVIVLDEFLFQAIDNFPVHAAWHSANR